MQQAPQVLALVGVYHADGGLLGEARYLLGHLLRQAHCSLCDITHSPVRRKPAWDRMVVRLGVPVHLRHRNEVHGAVAAAVASTGTPVLLAELADDSVHPLLATEALDVLGGSVHDFEAAVRAAVRSRGWQLAGPAGSPAPPPARAGWR
ncbi:MAG TPA: hypothetical protein VF143_11735 [Candidatus Nanopelagicales bacterium]